MKKIAFSIFLFFLVELLYWAVVFFYFLFNVMEVEMLTELFLTLLMFIVATLLPFVIWSYRVYKRWPVKHSSIQIGLLLILLIFFMSVTIGFNLFVFSRTF